MSVLNRIKRKNEQFKIATDFFDFGFEDDMSTVSPKDLVVYEGNVHDVKAYISAYHYSGKVPSSTMNTYIGKYGDTFAGACLFSNGISNHAFTRLVPWLEFGEFRELARLWSPDNMPRNTESRLISESLKLLRHHDVKLVLSYADSDQDHYGYVYQATNWYYLGMTSPAVRIIDTDGNYRHQKFTRDWRLSNPDRAHLTGQEILDLLGYTTEPIPGKHRYAYLLGGKREKQKMLKQFENMIEPYPKPEGKSDD